jgi:tetratricopeptide (TPR) repeat protein
MKLSLVAAALLAIAAPARADVDIPRADALFAEAQALKDTNPGAACTKFAASLEYNPQALGTLLNVALCDETFGRVASAVEKYEEALDRATEQNLPEYIAAAEEHLAPLRPLVPHLDVTFVEPPLPGTSLRIDDRIIPIDGSLKLTGIALDPGMRKITVSAPDRLTYETTLQIAPRESQRIQIPVLATPVVTSSRRTVGRVVVVSGAAVLTLGVGLGFLANARYNDQFESSPSVPSACNAMLQCTDAGQGNVDDARQLGTIGTIVGAVGVTAIAVGAYFWLTGERPGVHVVPTVSAEGSGVSAFGRF